MIRDFTKSALGFSWALSLLGLKQAGNLLRPNQQQGGDLLAPMTQVAVNQLDDSMRGIYRSGDNLQARTVDLMFAALNPMNWLNPNAWMRPFAGQGGCGRTNGQHGAGYTDPNAGGQGYTATNGNTGNGFTQAAVNLGQMVGQATSGFTQAVGQATAGLAQAVTGMAGAAGQPPNGSGAVPRNTAGNVPVSNESAAGGWGPMPGDS
jgi:hypothetical protein